MTDSLITRPVEEDEKKPDSVNDANPDQVVEPNKGTSLVTDGDTSNQGNVDWEKRYKDLQSFHSKRENELRKQIKNLEGQDAGFVAPTTPEEMEAFKEEHPQVYNMMLTMAHQVASEKTEGISSKIETYEQERMMNEVDKMKAKIREAHPDYSDIVNNKEFHDWASAQPMQVQEWIYNNPDDPDLAIIALDRYKASQASASTAGHPEKEANNKSVDTRNSAAAAVSTGSTPDVKDGGPKIWTASEIKKLSSEDFKKHEKDIDKAFAEGRVNFNA